MVGDENSLSDKDKLVTNENVETQQPPKVELTSPDKIKETLDRIYDKFYLIVHQTRSDLAQSIVEGGGYFKGPLEGTTLIKTPEEIMQVLPELDTDQRTLGVTHGGVDSAVIMAFPRSVIDKQSKDGVFKKFQHLDTIDETLADLNSNGLLDEYGIPNNLIVGYYADGKFNLNQNVNFEIPETWQDVKYTHEEAWEQKNNGEDDSEQTVAPFGTTSDSDSELPPPPTNPMRMP